MKRVCKFLYNNNNIFCLGSAIIILFISFSYSLSHNFDVSFYPINGDFQTYNGVRRLLAGQIPFRDFDYYLGFGPLYLTSLPLMFFNTFRNSKIATQFITIILISIMYYALLYYSLNKKKSLASLLTVIFIFITLQDIDLGFITRNFFSSVLTLSHNSIRIHRAVIMIPAAYFAVWWKKKSTIEIKYDILYALIIAICVIWSNDFGISTAMALSIFYFINSLKSKRLKFVIIKNIVVASATLVSIYVLVNIFTFGNFIEWFTYTKGAAEFQYWYYGGISKGALTVGSLFKFEGYEWLLLALIFYFNVKLFTNDISERFVFSYIALTSGFLGHYSYYIATLSKSESFIPRIIIFTIIVGYVISLLYDSYIEKKIYLNYLLVFIILCLSIKFMYYNPLKAPAIGGNSKYVEELGGYANEWYEEYDDIKKVVNNDTLWSVYASAHEAILNTYQPSGFDYIIHVLGKGSREDYLNSYNTIKPKYIAIPKTSFSVEAYNKWALWAAKANWFFYRNVFKDYRIKKENSYSILFERDENSGIAAENINEIKLKITGDDTSRILIEFNNPKLANNSKELVLDVKINYKTYKLSNLLLRYRVNVKDNWGDIIPDWGSFGLPKEYNGTVPVRFKNGKAILDLNTYTKDACIHMVSVDVVNVYKNILIDKEEIQVANVSDHNWENGIYREGNIVLFNYSKQNELVIDNAQYMILSDGSRVRIKSVDKHLPLWIHVEYLGEKIEYGAGYPNCIKFEN